MYILDFSARDGQRRLHLEDYFIVISYVLVVRILIGA